MSLREHLSCLTAIWRSCAALAPRLRPLLAVLFVVPAILGSSVAVAMAEADRSLKLFFTHTGERATITFKRDGRFDPKGLAEINRFLRDWRKNEPTKMDPRLLDLVWEVYRRSGAKDYIHIVSAYRSPSTNKMLRGRSRDSGVAKSSQHTLGKAMDFYIPGVKLSKLRAIAMQMQVGGVGYYPTSGSPFVHLDVGSVRAWPRMSRQELARIFPDGKTMHLPSNGRPLPGYEAAVADYKRRVGKTSMEIAATADSSFGPKTSTGSLLTAMLPEAKSSAEEALELQTGTKAATDPQAEFPDLARLAVPIPGAKPVTLPVEPEIETAALGPILPFSSRSVDHPAAITLLPSPDVSIGQLPILRSPSASVSKGDRQAALVSWALSQPLTGTRMTAPRLEIGLMLNVQGSAALSPTKAMH